MTAETVGGWRQNDPADTNIYRDTILYRLLPAIFTLWNAFHKQGDRSKTSGGTPCGEGGCSVFRRKCPGSASAASTGLIHLTSDTATSYCVVFRPPSSVHVDGGNGSAVVDADSAPPQLLFGIPWRAPAPHSYDPLCRGPRRMKPPNLRLRSPFCRLSCSGALLGSRSTIRSIIVGRI